MAFQSRRFKFVVWGKPPVKRRARGKTFYTPKATVEDEQRIRDNFLQFYVAPRSEARFSLRIDIRAWKRRTVDGDNVEKAVMDALQKVLWEKDRQVRQVWWVWHEVMDGELECIEIEALEL